MGSLDYIKLTKEKYNEISDLKELKEYRCKNCKATIHQGYYEVTCDNHMGEKPLKPKMVPEKSKKDIIKELDTNGNGRITKKEIKDFLKKDDK